ncbi:MAG: hypothetical protein KME27_23145 [Lyngbya sp. HA4199-MV5]|jgi:hypothetical protein|nr:hypothetical protein [Lyngbya sp. HA4199-MV5]
MTDQSRFDELETIRQLLATVARVAERNTTTIDGILTTQRMMQQDMQLSQSRWETVQAEIRGLQTENRRILERLEGLSN